MAAIRRKRPTDQEALSLGEEALAMRQEQSAAATTKAPATPSVLAVVEMNLEEYPAFRLGRRSKRPELRYLRARTTPDGRAYEQLWVVRGAEGLGLPGPFEQDLYVALLVLFTEQGLPADGRIRFTRNRLAQIMDCSNSGRGYELLEQGLSRLAGATIHTEHAFYRPGSLGNDGQRHGPAERLSLDFHILEEVRVYERRAASWDSWEDAAAPESDTVGDQPRVEHARPFEVSVARLGLPLVQSYERRYTKALDASFYFTLTRPLAKRLYRYVDKVRNGRGSFEMGIRGLADALGLEYRYPSDIKDGLAEAHAELEAQGFLTGASYAPMAGGPGAGEKVVYAFQPTFGKHPKSVTEMPPPPSLEESGQGVPMAQPMTQTATRSAAAEVTVAAADSAAHPLQEELVSFGISRKRAAALVAVHDAGHIAARLAYVRAQLLRPDAPRIKNPAGYLAKAIEDGYSVSPAVAVPAAGGLVREAPALSVVSGGSRIEDAAGQTLGIGAEGPVEGQLEDAPAVDTSDTPEAPDLETPWGRLAASLKERVSGATYAAWVAPAVPAADEAAGGTLQLVVPSTFALERWRRPPLAPALDEASAALGLTVELTVAPVVE